MDWTSIIIACIMGIPGVLALIQQRHKDEATAAGTLVGASVDLVDSLQSQMDAANLRINSLSGRVDAQDTEIAELKRENLWLRNGVGVLIQQLRNNRIEPEFTLEK